MQWFESDVPHVTTSDDSDADDFAPPQKKRKKSTEPLIVVIFCHMHPNDGMSTYTYPSVR